jgi:hypothetical protein
MIERGKKPSSDVPTNRQQNTEKKRTREGKNCTHTTFVSDKSLFCARLIFNNNNNNVRKIWVFQKNVFRKKGKNHEHKMTCNEEMLLIHVCV